MTTTPSFVERLLVHRWTAIVATGLVTLPYWTSGLAKLTDLPAALGEARHFGLEPALLVVGLTILVQLGGSLLVILGRAAWLGAGALGVFTAIATLIAHPFWQIAEPVAKFHARNTFLEHIALIGGLVAVAILRSRTP